jgi:mRNA interferase HigB
MEIAGLSTIEKFKKVQQASRNPLDDWITKVTPVIWKTPNDVKKTFSTASFVKSYVIFNISGNKYRLLTTIRYETGKIIILKIGTHEKYDRWEL